MWFQELSSSTGKGKKIFQLYFTDRAIICCYLHFQLISKIFKTHNSQIKLCSRAEISKKQRNLFHAQATFSISLSIEGSCDRH